MIVGKAIRPNPRGDYQPTLPYCFPHKPYHQSMNDKL